MARWYLFELRWATVPPVQRVRGVIERELRRLDSADLCDEDHGPVTLGEDGMLAMWREPSRSVAEVVAMVGERHPCKARRVPHSIETPWEESRERLEREPWTESVAMRWSEKQ